jgi:2,5-furandicarboxylate decarboxylase 1
MMGENFRSWLEDWERRGWLTRVTKPVNPRYVLGAVTKKLEKEKGVLFQKVSGCSVPLVTNFFFSRKSLAAALGMEEKDLIPSLREAMANPRRCEVVGKAPFQENVMAGDLNLLKILPIPTYHERDAGPYITGGVLIVKDPETGARNASIHRIQVFEDGLLGLLILPRHLNLCLQKSRQLGRPLEVAVAIGVDPFTLLASQAILPFGVDELEVANAMRPTSPLKLARCTTVDIEVPVDSEIVLEGTIDPLESRVEGPFGEFPRYYSTEASRPVLRLKAISHRKEPFFYSILPASREHLLLGAIPREASILTDVQRVTPSARAVHLTYGGTCRYHLIISLAKKSEGEVRSAMLAAMVNNADIKHVVVVDEDIDIFDMEQVEWAIATRFQGDRDLLIIPKTQSSLLDPSSSKGVGTKLGIDATVPLGSLQKEFKPIYIPGYKEINLEEYL